MMTPRIEQSLPPEISIQFGMPPQSLTTLLPIRLNTRLAANQIPNATLVLKQPGGDRKEVEKFSADAQRCLPGTTVRIELKDNNKSTVLFTGIVAEQHNHWTLDGNELTLRLCHLLQGALSSHGSQVFSNMTDEEALRQLLRLYKVDLGPSRGMMSIRHPQLVQYECSDWQFIKARLHANGVWLWPDVSGGVSIAPPALSSAKHMLAQDAKVLTGESSHTPLIEIADWIFSSRELTSEVHTITWNTKNQKAETRQSQPKQLGSNALDPKMLVQLGPKSQTFHAARNLQDEELDAWANSRLLSMQAASVRGTFTVIGSSAYQLGETLELKGFGKTLDGQGVISGIEHHMTPGRWRTDVTLGQDTINVSLVPATPGLQIGVVSHYQSDPDNLDRLQVEVPIFGNAKLWARFAKPFASKDSGACFYPEPGDEVVLGFFEADPRFPVILGAMHNPKQPSPIDPVKHLQQRGLILKQGDKQQQLLFDGEAQTVQLQAADKEHLMLGAKTGFAAQSQQDVQIKGKNLTLQADTALEARGQQVKVKGNKVDVGA
ncbi:MULTISPECIES: phage baseplate assembly protein V [unclassified Chromobacterium]|uniref:phage baseplate assembly protein V n=1 Tax=unclassified Chromobacterium TaxID=2641838 RepID=UPI001F3D4FDC|nr:MULTISPECIES: phage baseplate assembly protein V [unclassified Chromobacterium]MCP1293298.1 phage baseplate assembly protein V [Chromobacterium sp. S0633]UJB32742.1 hypothetical protein HQN78_17810 [Chromobacterium sp. Beijing]